MQTTQKAKIDYSQPVKMSEVQQVCAAVQHAATWQRPEFTTAKDPAVSMLAEKQVSAQ